jgi:hypothetical protein
MLTAERRGTIEGGQAAASTQSAYPDEELRSIAYGTLTRLRAKGYAYLDPEESFVDGFIGGWKVSQQFQQKEITYAVRPENHP